MGFMSETVTVVGSSAYNLAGAPASRGNYLKNTLLSSVLSGSSQRNGMGHDILVGHMKGPGTDLINYGKWSESSGYGDRMGFPKGMVNRGYRVDQGALDLIYPVASNRQTEYVNSTVRGVNYQLLTQSHVSENMPDYVGMDFTVTAETTQTYVGDQIIHTLTGRLIIQFSNTERYFFTPTVDITSSGDVVYVYFRDRVISEPDTEIGDWIIVPEENLPSTQKYSLTDNQSNAVTFPMYRRTVISKVFSDNRPTEESDDTVYLNDIIKNNTNAVYKQTIIEPVSGSGVGLNETTLTLQLNASWAKSWLGGVTTEETVVVSPGITTTITTTTYDEVVTKSHSYRKDSSTILTDNWRENRIVPYLRGTNAVIDAYIFTGVGLIVGSYLPIIPVRITNKPVDAENYPEQYPWNLRASRKAFKSKKSFITILNNLEENENIDQIDHAWLVFGASLGSTEKEALNYNYIFLKELIEFSGHSNRWTASEYASAVLNYFNSADAYANYSYDGGGYDPGSRPPRPVPPQPALFQFSTFNTSGSSNNPYDSPWLYNIRISCQGGAKTVGVGYHPRANGKKNACWIYRGPDVPVKNVATVSNGEAGDTQHYFYETAQVVRFGKQLTEDSWEEYEVFDLTHENFVHDGLSVITTADKSFAEGEDSSFLVPMNTQVLRDMNLIKRTQLALGSSYMVINYYDRQKIPWYATGLFKIVLVIIVVVVAVYTGGAGAAGGGVLGANAAVGVALGFTAGSLAAIVAGAVANALAAAIISAVISKVSTLLLGDKLGSIVGAIVSMVVVWGMSSGGNFNTSEMMHGFTKADNLLKLTMQGANMIGQGMADRAQEIIDDTKSLLSEYTAKVDQIAEMTQNFMGSSGIDPMVVSEATRNLVESPEKFLGRTLMTGDDIVDTSLYLIERFPEPQMKLPYIGE